RSEDGLPGRKETFAAFIPEQAGMNAPNGGERGGRTLNACTRCTSSSATRFGSRLSGSLPVNAARVRVPGCAGDSGTGLTSIDDGVLARHDVRCRPGQRDDAGRQVVGGRYRAGRDRADDALLEILVAPDLGAHVASFPMGQHVPPVGGVEAL